MSGWRDQFDDSRVAIGAAPISSDQPAGAPVRDGAGFTALEDEVRKLETNGPSAVLWPQVRDQALEILRSEGKDLLPACWLCYALYRVEGFHGLATGLALLDEMCAAHWDELQPPAKRVRGRAGVFDWLSERLTPLLENEAPPQSDDLAVVTAFEAVDSLSTLLDERLPLDTTLSVLVRTLRNAAGPARQRLEAADVERQRAETERQQAEEAAAAAAATPSEASENSEAAPVPPAASDGGAAQPAPVVTPSAAPSPPPASAPASTPAVPAVAVQAGDLDRTMSQLGDAMRQVARLLREASAADARSYTLLRTAIWSRVSALPEADGGRSMMPAPDPDMVGLLERDYSAGSYAAVVAQAEEIQADSPFFVTASRWSASALRALGPEFAGAADAVEAHTGFFLRRFPELSSLTFSDGTPFADADTLTWLQSTQASGGGGGGGDPTAETASKARGLLAGGKAAEAMALLEAKERTSTSGRERFFWQLAKASLCLDAGRIPDAVALAGRLLNEGQAKGLEDFDPDLVADAAEIRLKALLHTAATGVYSEDELAQLRRQARVDLVKIDASRAFAYGL